MKRVAVILSGCGVMDGSEIHEATLSLLYLDQAKVATQCFAPNKDQLDVIDHKTNELISRQKRNTLSESARIARGKILPLSELKVDQFNALIFPGGFGAAKNLTTFALDGPDCTIDAEVATIIQQAIAKSRAIGAICIAPVVVARALRDSGVSPRLTIGDDPEVIEALRKMNAEPISAKVSDIVVDEKLKIVSTPAYMLATGIAEAARGINKLIEKVLEIAPQT
ncbi:MAG: isoprenoid biosynthesis glyoxalase ElbB [Planctomycetes bacterium]|nr:isoprenoid biosynthesis glyoxalase ElbB [Planctomycetota bacterium]